jgi:hypothetical protein
MPQEPVRIDFSGYAETPSAERKTRIMQKLAEVLHREAASASSMEILTPAQLAERLHVKPSWVYEQTRERADVRNLDPLPFIKMGRYLRFDWPDVVAWLDRQKRGIRNYERGDVDPRSERFSRIASRN